MQLLLNFNYKKVQVSIGCTQKVAVTMNASRFEHFEFAGFLCLESAIERINDSDSAYFAAFFGSSGWRQLAIDSWSFTGKEEYMVAFLIEDEVYAITNGALPLVWSSSQFSKVVYPIYDPSKKEEKSRNVVNLFPAKAGVAS